MGCWSARPDRHRAGGRARWAPGSPASRQGGHRLARPAHLRPHRADRRAGVPRLSALGARVPPVGRPRPPRSWAAFIVTSLLFGTMRPLAGGILAGAAFALTYTAARPRRPDRGPYRRQRADRGTFGGSALGNALRLASQAEMTIFRAFAIGGPGAIFALGSIVLRSSRRAPPIRQEEDRMAFYEHVLVRGLKSRRSKSRRSSRSEKDDQGSHIARPNIGACATSPIASARTAKAITR